MAVCNLACEGLTGASTTLDLAQRKLYIGGLSPDVTSEALLSFFGRHGEIEEGSVAYDKDTNESRYVLLIYFCMYCYRSILNCGTIVENHCVIPSKCSGFGFVTYKTVEAAKKAIDDPQKLLGVSADSPRYICL